MLEWTDNEQDAFIERISTVLISTGTGQFGEWIIPRTAGQMLDCHPCVIYIIDVLIPAFGWERSHYNNKQTKPCINLAN